MRIDGHYDRDIDIAWLRFEGYDPATVVAEEAEPGLREIDPETGKIVGLEYWNASRTLPHDFLAMLPPPTVAFMRYLAAELGPRGVRVCGIWTAGVAETLTKEKLAEVGGVATFLASDRAAGITGTMTNVTSGLVLR